MLSSYTITTNINVLYNYCNNFNTLHPWSLANQLSLTCVLMLMNTLILLFHLVALQYLNFTDTVKRYSKKLNQLSAEFFRKNDTSLFSHENILNNIIKYRYKKIEKLLIK